MNTPTGLSDYILPEEIVTHQQRTRERRWALITWFVWLLAGLLALALVVPTG